ncbi:MAG: hypothetical protein HKN89_00600 [Eudoraea sp.]|nr:hypothetical protein [Eudoraea sp.]
MIKPGALHTALEAASHGATDMIGHAAEAAGHGDGHGGGHATPPGYKLPGLLEIGTFLGFLASFLYVSLTQLSKASLIPKNDPYLAESLHHHT